MANAKPAAEEKAAKPKTGRAPGAPKAAAATKAKKEVAGGKLKVTQTGSKIARRHDQEATLIGLGLNKRHRSRVLADTPEIRGMIRKVSHLVTVETVS